MVRQSSPVFRAEHVLFPLPIGVIFLAKVAMSHGRPYLILTTRSRVAESDLQLLPDAWKSWCACHVSIQVLGSLYFLTPSLSLSRSRRSCTVHVPPAVLILFH